MIKKYKTKPCVIEAIQWNGDNFDEIYKFTERKSRLESINNERFELIVNTLEGKMIASRGDYIIKGLRGKFYPCKPDIFEATYEVLNSMMGLLHWL